MIPPPMIATRASVMRASFRLPDRRRSKQRNGLVEDSPDVDLKLPLTGHNERLTGFDVDQPDGERLPRTGTPGSGSRQTGGAT